MRTIVVGKGIQGLKRAAHCGEDFVSFVDTAYEKWYMHIEAVPLNSYDAALVCVPYSEQEAILHFLLSHGKHVMVEKPLVLQPSMYGTIEQVAQAHEAVLYTAYNHRFEPHLIRMKQMLDNNELGEIYSVRMFYGNGTAQNVKGTWRDKSILHEIGSHLFDLLYWWNGKLPLWKKTTFSRSETNTPDYVMVQLGEDGISPITLEMTWLSWRNTFTCYIIGSKGSAHIDGLCKWGPSTFTHRHRILPSGKPLEERVTLEQDDPTWRAEYAYFKGLIENKHKTDLSWDAELMRTFKELERGI